MRSTTLATISVLASLAAASAFGQQAVRVDVPFEFSVSDIVLPAGQYDVTSKPGVVRIYSYTSQTAVLATTNNIGGGPNEDTRARLIFSKYGGEYFLSEVWPEPGSPFGIAVTKSMTERETARSAGPVARVFLPARPAGVAAQVAAKRK